MQPTGKGLLCRKSWGSFPHGQKQRGPLCALTWVTCRCSRALHVKHVLPGERSVCISLLAALGLTPASLLAFQELRQPADVPTLLHVPHLRVCILSRKSALAIREGWVWKQVLSVCPSSANVFSTPLLRGRYLGRLWNSQNSFLTVLFLQYLGLQCCPPLASGFKVNSHPQSSRHPLCGACRRAPALALGNHVPTGGFLSVGAALRLLGSLNQRLCPWPAGGWGWFRHGFFS